MCRMALQPSGQCPSIPKRLAPLGSTGQAKSAASRSTEHGREFFLPGLRSQPALRWWFGQERWKSSKYSHKYNDFSCHFCKPFNDCHFQIQSFLSHKKEKKRRHMANIHWNGGIWQIGNEGNTAGDTQFLHHIYENKGVFHQKNFRLFAFPSMFQIIFHFEISDHFCCPQLKWLRVRIAGSHHKTKTPRRKTTANWFFLAPNSVSFEVNAHERSTSNSAGSWSECAIFGAINSWRHTPAPQGVVTFHMSQLFLNINFKFFPGWICDQRVSGVALYSSFKSCLPEGLRYIK